MARGKKQEEGGGGSPAWMATFADLMNLLLCFFVLLFSMSTVDAENYEALLASLSGNFSVFTSGSSMVGEDIYVASGASQMIEISEYFAEFTEDGGQDGYKEFDNVSEYEQMMEEKQQEVAEKLYEDVSEQADKAKLDGMVSVEMDENYQYVRITIGGAILFDSAEAELKKKAEIVISKVGDILKSYDKHLIKIEGHTDNVPISGSRFESNMQLSMLRAESVFNYLINKKKLDPATLEPSGRGEFCPVADNTTAEGRAQNRRVEFKIYTEDIEGE